MNATPPFQKIALIGFGLIGGSIARAARAQGLAGEIVTTARSAKSRARVAELGIVDAVVATNARLDKASAQRLAVMAQDGLARSIRPVHTPQDGDTVFAIATGKRDLGNDPLALAELGTLAADCLARAVARGVYNAATLGAARGWRDGWRAVSCHGRTTMCWQTVT